MYAVERIAAYDLLAQLQRIVVHDRHVVGIPAHRARHVQHHLGDEQQQRRNLVGHDLRGVEMPRIEGHDLAAAGSVADVEVVAPDGIALQPDAEHLRLDAVLHVVVFGLEDAVERVTQQLAVEHAVHRKVFRAVVYPEVHDRGVALRLAHLFGNGAAALGVFHPEVPDSGVGVGQREIAALGVRERRRVEVELHAVLFRPLDPALEMPGLHLVAVDRLAAELAVDLVQVQAVRTGNERLGLEDVGTQLFDVAGFARVVARSLDAAREVAAPVFEARHVVRLPAVERERDVLKRRERLFGVYADLRIAFPRDGVCLFDKFRFHKDDSFIFSVDMFSFRSSGRCSAAFRRAKRPRPRHAPAP